MAGPQIQLILDYFRTFNISAISLLLCLSDERKTFALRKMTEEGFQVSFGLNSHSAGTVLDLNCNRKILKHMEGEWLLFGKVEDAASLPVLPDTRVTLYAEDDRLLDVYRPSMSSPLRLANFTGRRDHSDFGGITLKAVAVNERLVSGGVEDSRELFGEYGCLSRQEGGWAPNMSEVLVNHLANQLNFRVKRRKVANCRSLYRALVGGEADFSSTAVMMTPERMDYSRFIGDIYEHKSMILYKQPGLSVMRNIYVLPFHKNVWLCCLSLFLLCFALLLIANFVHPGAFVENTYQRPMDLFTLVIGVASQQGIELGAQTLSTRMSLLLFSICSLFLYTSYSANIVALIQSTAKTVASISELAASPLRMAIQDRPYNRKYLQDSHGEVEQLYKAKIVEGNKRCYISAEEGVKKMKSELFAFQVETSRAYQLISRTYTEKEKCGLSELHVYTFPRFSIPVIKSSGYREYFTSRLSRQRECGLIKQAERRFLSEKPACTASDSGFISVTFGDFLPCLLVLCWGAAAAVAALLAEVAAVRCSFVDQLKRKKDK